MLYSDELETAPVFLQIADILQTEIDNGKFQPGELLPSEAALCKRFKNNRYTIRKSLNRLVQIGLILPQKGIGYLINKKPLEFHYQVTSVTRYSNLIKAMGRVPRAKIMDQRKIKPAHVIADHLKLEGESEVYKLEIVRYAGETPTTWSETYLPASVFPGLLNKTMAFTSLYAMFEQHYGIIPKRMQSTFQAVIPTAREAFHLDISVGTPLIQIESVVCDQWGQPIELTYARYRGDICRVSIEF